MIRGRPGVQLAPVVAAMLWCEVCAAAADSLSVSHATAQTRSGGQAGRTGTRYTVVLVSRLRPSSVEVAGIWMDGEYIPAGTDDAQASRRRTYVTSARKGGVTEYTITLAVSESAAPGAERAHETDRAHAPPPPPSPLEAKAMLDLRVDGTRRYVPIPRFEVLPSISFP